jgi:hypothetical protein
VLGVLMVCAAVVYLGPFVPRGWVPHDEGMLGQSAEWVLLGGLPHVDYEEPYTGGLSLLYAGLFKAVGIDLVHLRWLLFAAAAAAQFIVYVIARRFLAPIGAAITTWIALAWSFPNYFAGIPSWWVLICALLLTWALLRHFEVGGVRYLVIAGLAAGAAILIKQTGAYLLPPLVMSLSFGQMIRGGQGLWTPQRVTRMGVAALGVTGAIVIMRAGLGSGEVVYLLLPIAAVGLAFGWSADRLTFARHFRVLAVAGAAAALPVVLFLVPYVLDGHLDEFLQGALVLPQKRVEFARVPMPPAALILAGFLPAALVVLPLPPELARRARLLSSVRWVLMLALSVFAARNVLTYQLIWQSGRGLAALLPIGALWLLMSRRMPDIDRQRVFVLSSVLAWSSLVQFPYGTGIYFCYAAPLAVLAGVAVADRGAWLARSWALPVAAAMIIFAIGSMHPSYVRFVGAWSAAQTFDAPLGLPRAHLNVSAEDADTYRRLVSGIEAHVGTGTLLAGPDAPEVYFLTGRRSPSGTFFDFFSDKASGEGDAGRIAKWSSADVVVLNPHPAFSPPPSEAVMTAVRQQFPHGETIGRFDVRWR